MKNFFRFNLIFFLVTYIIPGIFMFLCYSKICLILKRGPRVADYSEAVRRSMESKRKVNVSMYWIQMYCPHVGCKDVCGGDLSVHPLLASLQPLLLLQLLQSSDLTRPLHQAHLPWPVLACYGQCCCQSPYLLLDVQTVIYLGLLKICPLLIILDFGFISIQFFNIFCAWIRLRRCCLISYILTQEFSLLGV